VHLLEERADHWARKPEATQWTKPLNWGLAPEKRHEALRATYASSTFMNAGRLLMALDSLGLRDSTIIVFGSDYGYNVGQHGQWLKQSLFEHAALISSTSPPKRYSAAHPLRPRHGRIRALGTPCQAGG